MKTPPFLLLAVLLFWGWQSGLLLAGAVMGLALESPRLVKARWELSDADLRRILAFCVLLAFVTAVYAFTSNEAGDSVSGWFRGEVSLRNAGLTSQRASSAFFRWLPMTLFLFALAQLFSRRETIPWAVLRLTARRRAPAKPAGDTAAPAGRGLNVAYPYFIVCLFSAGIHPNEGSGAFFWGECALAAWALWPFRGRRFGNLGWVAAVAAVAAFGFCSQRGIGALQRVLEGYNAQWIARFLRQRTDPAQSATAIGQIGELKLSGRIVIRLWPESGAPPVYLREASYRAYAAEKQVWTAGTPHTDFEAVSPQPNQTTWMLLPGKTNTASATIACYLDGGKGLLPLPTGSSQLDHLDAFLLSKNREGAVLAEGPGLVIFDARYGPGATLDAPPDAGTNSLDLAVPTNEAPALDRVIAEMNLSGANEERILQTVSGFFATDFRYGVWQGWGGAGTTNETPLTRFLLASRRGHCEYFATATVLLLRELKIPARYAVGYYVHERSGGGYVVRERDAHAWCLVWNRRTHTWEDFDTTPASWVAAEDQRTSAWQWLSDAGSWIGFQIAKVRWGRADLRYYILWSLVPVLVLLLYQILFRRGRRLPGKPPEPAKDEILFQPGLDSEFYRLERRLAARGVPRQPGEPLSAWLVRATDEPALKELRPPLLELLRLHYRLRFDPRGLSREERGQLARAAQNGLDALSRTAGK